MQSNRKHQKDLFAFNTETYVISCFTCVIIPFARKFMVENKNIRKNDKQRQK